MDRVLLGESLPLALTISDKRIPPSSRRSIDRCITSPVRDVWSRELREKTSDTAHRRSAEFATRRTSNVDCDNAWNLDSLAGCKMDSVAFMEKVWTVVQSYGTQSILKLGLNRLLMREVDECKGRLSKLLIDSATDESEANSPIKMTRQEDKGEVVYLSRTRMGTMRSKTVIVRINEMQMKLGSKVTLRKTAQTKVHSETSMKAVNSAKRKRVEEAIDLGQGDYQLPGTDRMLTDVAMVPSIHMA